MRFKSFLLVLTIFINFVCISHANAKEHLIFAIDLIRHGDRTPIHELPKSPYPWREGLGELTAEGMNQEFQHGVKFRKRYIEQNHLLPSHYLAETLYVRSSDLNRTLMSAQSLLMGLYPLGTGPRLSSNGKPGLPYAYQPIPIHTVALDQETLFISDYDKEHYIQLLSKYVFTGKEWIQKTRELQSKFKGWSETTGLPITHLEEVTLLGNNLYIRQLHHVPLPKGISQEDADTIISTANWTFGEIFKSKQITDPVGRSMLSAMENYLQLASQKKTPLKYVLFSGHDTTLACVLNTLGAPTSVWPPYASDLNFALYENNGNYYVKINFNDTPVAVPACGGNSCTLQQLSKIIHSS